MITTTGLEEDDDGDMCDIGHAERPSLLKTRQWLVSQPTERDPGERHTFRISCVLICLRSLLYDL